MKIYKNIEEFKNKLEAVLTIGSFDGIHLAHKAIIKELKNKSKLCNAKSLVITFEPHPQLVLNNNKEFKLLTQLNEKIHILKNLNIDALLILKFDSSICKLRPEEFIKYLSNYLVIKGIVVGYNHLFGKNKQGNFNLLTALALQYGFKVSQMPEITLQGNKISSSKIRKMLFALDINNANKLLGYNYSFEGKVIYGDQLGRKIGFPTANLAILHPNKLILPDACYVVKVQVNKKIFNGMMYIGNRPTVNGITHNIEVNIFDFDANIYGETIRVFVIDYLRADYKFSSLEDLVFQLNIDKSNSIKILKNY